MKVCHCILGLTNPAACKACYNAWETGQIDNKRFDYVERIYSDQSFTKIVDENFGDLIEEVE